MSPGRWWRPFVGTSELCVIQSNFYSLLTTVSVVNYRNWTKVHHFFRTNVRHVNSPKWQKIWFPRLVETLSQREGIRQNMFLYGQNKKDFYVVVQITVITITLFRRYLKDLYCIFLKNSIVTKIFLNFYIVRNE